jgi:hypothetical protein
MDGDLARKYTNKRKSTLNKILFKNYPKKLGESGTPNYGVY